MMDLAQPLSVLWRPFLEITVFWFAYYLLFVYIKDSGMTQALKGLILVVVFFFVAEALRLETIRWIFSHLFQISIIGFLVIFQTELRRGLTRIGQSPLFKLFLKEKKLVDEVSSAVILMSKKKIGALIAIEREVGLKPYVESGITLDGILTTELLLTIFMPNTPFHDGGAVIQGGRVLAVGCLFPLSDSQKLSKMLGTRHRAGLGLSEETDALVIVVSEETGVITLMTQGKIIRDIDDENLKQSLTDLYEPQRSASKQKKTKEI